MSRPGGDEGRRVVVGLDDSPSSRAALRHALQEARERGARLDVVVAVDRAAARTRVLTAARSVVDEVLAADAVERIGCPVPDLRVRVEVGRPGAVLVAASRGADVLVVGHRGRGATGTSVIGSVAWRCLAHAAGPVTVVPSPGAPPSPPWPHDRAVDEAP